jgi:hypothetical protein
MNPPDWNAIVLGLSWWLSIGLAFVVGAEWRAIHEEQPDDEHDPY